MGDLHGADLRSDAPNSNGCVRDTSRAAGHVNAAGKTRFVGEESPDLHSSPREDTDMRAASAAGANDDLRCAVAGKIARRHADSASETSRIGEEAGQFAAGHSAKGTNVGSAPGAWARDDV